MNCCDPSAVFPILTHSSANVQIYLCGVNVHHFRHPQEYKPVEKVRSILQWHFMSLNVLTHSFHIILLCPRKGVGRHWFPTAEHCV